MTFKGYHTKVHTTLPALERTRANALGVYEEVVMLNGITKLVTFFPESWNEETIQQKVTEAAQPNNRIGQHEQGFIGKTSEGVLIAFWIQHNAIDNTYNTIFYPLLETVAKQ